jgi:hypothetical protein
MGLLLLILDLHETQNRATSLTFIQDLANVDSLGLFGVTVPLKLHLAPLWSYIVNQLNGVLGLRLEELGILNIQRWNLKLDSIIINKSLFVHRSRGGLIDLVYGLNLQPGVISII